MHTLTPLRVPGVTDVRQIFVPDILLIEDLCRVLRMTPSGARAALRAGRIPGRRLGRRWVVSREALLALLARNTDAQETLK